MEYLKTVVEKLGFDADTLAKIENNELSVDEAVTGYVSKIEKTTAERIAKQIEESKSSELFNAAYSKTEKILADTFAVDLKKYETVDKKDRLKTLVSDLKNQQAEMIESLKKDYSSADAQKLQQLTQQLELANAKLSEKERMMQEAIQAEQMKFNDYLKNQQIEKVRNKLIESVKDARLEPKHMRAIFEAELKEKGYNLELDADGNIWINKDGNRVKHPNKPTENLKYETLFEIVAEENAFNKQSNAGEREKIKIDPKTAEVMHPSRIAYLKSKGMI
jgi:hypothetical protein